MQNCRTQNKRNWCPAHNQSWAYCHVVRVGSGTVHQNKHFLTSKANPSTNVFEDNPEITQEAPAAVTSNRKKKTQTVLDPAPSTLTDPVPDIPPWSVPEPEQSSRLGDLRTLPPITLRHVCFLFLLHSFLLGSNFIGFLFCKKGRCYHILYFTCITLWPRSFMFCCIWY